MIVLDSVYGPFVERLAGAVEALSVGDPADSATQIGPVIDRGRQQAFASLANSTDKVITGGRGR